MGYRRRSFGVSSHIGNILYRKKENKYQQRHFTPYTSVQWKLKTIEERIYLFGALWIRPINWKRKCVKWWKNNRKKMSFGSISIIFPFLVEKKTKTNKYEIDSFITAAFIVRTHSLLLAFIIFAGSLIWLWLQCNRLFLLSLMGSYLVSVSSLSFVNFFSTITDKDLASISSIIQ